MSLEKDTTLDHTQKTGEKFRDRTQDRARPRVCQRKRRTLLVVFHTAKKIPIQGGNKGQWHDIGPHDTATQFWDTTKLHKAYRAGATLLVVKTRIRLVSLPVSAGRAEDGGLRVSICGDADQTALPLNSGG